MSKYLKTYIDLLNCYLMKKISSDKFYEDFSKLFYKKTLKPLNDIEFAIIDELWGWLDTYEPNPKIRKGAEDIYLNKKQLYNKVKEYKEKINRLIKK